MPFYLMLSRLTERGRDRIKPEDQGCRVISQYARLGRYDFATVIEAPDNAHMSRLAIDLGARGTIETETLPAEPTDLFIASMKGE